METPSVRFPRLKSSCHTAQWKNTFCLRDGARIAFDTSDRMSHLFQRKVLLVFEHWKWLQPGLCAKSGASSVWGSGHALFCLRCHDVLHGWTVIYMYVGKATHVDSRRVCMSYNWSNQGHSLRRLYYCQLWTCTSYVSSVVGRCNFSCLITNEPIMSCSSIIAQIKTYV